MRRASAQERTCDSLAAALDDGNFTLEVLNLDLFTNDDCLQEIARSLARNRLRRRRLAPLQEQCAEVMERAGSGWEDAVAERSVMVLDMLRQLRRRRLP